MILTMGINFLAMGEVGASHVNEISLKASEERRTSNNASKASQIVSKRRLSQATNDCFKALVIQANKHASINLDLQPLFRSGVSLGPHFRP